jgi:hypothetical protein
MLSAQQLAAAPSTANRNSPGKDRDLNLGPRATGIDVPAELQELDRSKLPFVFHGQELHWGMSLRIEP